MKTTKTILLSVLILFFYFGVVPSINAQKRTEKVSQEEKGSGEDELVIDEGKKKKKKKLVKPKPIGFALHDKYSDEVWNYLQKTKELTKLAAFIKVKLIETNDDNGEVTNELIITNGLGENLTWKNALTQLKEIEKNLTAQQKKGEELKVLSAKLETEKIPFKKMGKSMKQTKNNLKIQALATAELGKTLFALGKNIATIIKVKRMTNAK